MTPLCPPPTPSIQTFTSSYMARSMSAAVGAGAVQTSRPLAFVQGTQRECLASPTTQGNTQIRPITTTCQRNLARVVVTPKCFEYEDALGGKYVSSSSSG